MLIIKNQADVAKLEVGGAYLIDTFPPPDSEDQFPTTEMFAERERLEKLVQNHLLEIAKTVPLTEAELNGMLEIDVVAYAETLGISASVRDKKSDTIKRILDFQKQQ